MVGEFPRQLQRSCWKILDGQKGRLVGGLQNSLASASSRSFGIEDDARQRELQRMRVLKDSKVAKVKELEDKLLEKERVPELSLFQSFSLHMELQVL